MVRRNSVLLALALSAGCGIHRPPIVAPPGVSSERGIPLHGHTLQLHLADARTRAGAPLLLYATGDGGWHRKDLDFYRHLVAWGYPVAGFDAREYVTHLGTEPTTTPARVARDYQTMIAAAREALALREHVPVVLVGVSRGADLAVVAAGARQLRGQLAGVVVAGLTKEEEYVRWYRRIGRHRSDTREIVQIYEYLSRLGSLPITVVQSTRDNYLPAASARALFGPDRPGRHLIAIDATNHSFGGARDRLYAAVQSALGSLSRTVTYGSHAEAAGEQRTVTDLTPSARTSRARGRSRAWIAFAAAQRAAEIMRLDGYKHRTTREGACIRPIA